MNRLRWKAFYFELRNSAYNSTNDLLFDTLSNAAKNFILRKSAPGMKKLKDFEDDLFNMIKNIKFTNFKSKYQRELSRDLKELLSKNMVIIRSVKTSNLYYATPPQIIQKTNDKQPDQ